MTGHEDVAVTNSPEEWIEVANRFYLEVCTAQEPLREEVNRTLLAAWNAGEALLRTKKLLGHGKWGPYIERHFAGSSTTAKRYMQLRKSLTDVNDLTGKSLKDAYREIGMVSDTPTPPPESRPAPPAKHLYLAQQLAAHVRRVMGTKDSIGINRLKNDLSPLRKEIDRLVNFPSRE